MKYARECDCCWQKITAYTHNLNAQLIGAFEKLVEFRSKKRVPASLSDLDLTINQYSNFQKLQYFKIVFRNELWRQPSEKGLLFFQWKIQCENRTANFGKQTLPLDHEAWQTDSKWRKKMWIWDFNADHKWKQKGEYQSEKQSNMKSLFSFS